MKEIFKKIIEKLEENSYVEAVDDMDAYGDIEHKVVRLDDAIKIVKQEAEKYDNGWIPCDSVHFPEENVYVRVTTWTEAEKIGFRRDGKWFVYGSDGMTEATVLAWQPTQPYQPKGE